MIHAWLHAKGANPGHTAAFKTKMRELGLSSIYHDLGTAKPFNESAKRYILRCEKCTMEVLRKRKPPAHLMCARCRRSLTVFEVVEMREVAPARAASRASRLDHMPEHQARRSADERERQERNEPRR
jgi:hypothetical protein